MKCPKCGYLGFDQVDRCRNCGYDFSLAQVVVVPELPIQSPNASIAPLDDLSLLDEAAPPASAARSGEEVGPDLDRVFGAERAAREAELPLFGTWIDDDVPLITRPSAPRAPLAVRRATPEVPRVRGEQSRAHPLALTLELDSEIIPIAGDPASVPDRSLTTRAEDAGYLARLFAVLVDLLLLASVDAAVVYLTMQICGLSLREIRQVPIGPLVAFLLVQNGGYLVVFTAGGQTLGKMAAGIRIVPADPGNALDLGRALVRTLVWVVLAIPAGLGFLTAVFSRDRRGLHDRCAGTRVVRAAAA